MQQGADDGPPVSGGGRSVLLVDDSTWNRKTVAATLRQAGLPVAEAGDGPQALQLLREHESWLAVITDIQMPGMDGLALARAIRAAGFAELPLIGLTAHRTPELDQAAHGAGMACVLGKPVDALTLLGALDAGPLLDSERIEGFRRLGMLEELLADYLPEIDRMVQKLESLAGSADREACTQVLHTLLGMSGEAGAGALHRAVRRSYVAIQEGRWPLPAGWQAAIRSLAEQTGLALRAGRP